MDSFPPLKPQNGRDRAVVVDAGKIVDDRTPLLTNTASTDEIKPLEERWRPGPGFVWIEIGPVPTYLLAMKPN